MQLNANRELQTEWYSRKVNRVLKQVHVLDVLGIFHKIRRELGNREALSRDDESARATDASETFLCQASLSWGKVSCEPKMLRTM